jgi:cell division protein FtsW
MTDPQPKKIKNNGGAPAYDGWLLFPVFFLVGIGVVMVYSASSALALKSYGTDRFFLERQAVFSLVGLVALVICRRIPMGFLKRIAYPLLILAICLLAAVLIHGVGWRAGGATRWIRLGGFTFQPSELARFALVIYLAYSLSKKGDRLGTFAIGVAPHILVLTVLGCLIALQPDFGSVLILCILTWIMLFVGGVRLRHLLLPMAAAVPLMSWFLVTAPYRVKRLMSFMDPWQHNRDGGYQVVHSLMAFGSGGLWGVGLGQGYQKLFYLPEPHTDFIFSVIGEELGLIGVLFILGLYCLILWRGIHIARHAGDPFDAMVALGLTTALGLQVGINMGVTLGLLPTKGLTLPFMSYGGTSLVVNMAAVGVLMRVGAGRAR